MARRPHDLAHGVRTPPRGDACPAGPQNAQRSRRCRGGVHTVHPCPQRVGCHVRRLDRSPDLDPLNECPRTLIRPALRCDGQPARRYSCMSPPSTVFAEQRHRPVRYLWRVRIPPFELASATLERVAARRRPRKIHTVPAKHSCRKTRPCTCSAESAPRSGLADPLALLAVPCPEASGLRLLTRCPRTRCAFNAGTHPVSGPGSSRDRYWPCLRPYEPGAQERS